MLSVKNITIMPNVSMLGVVMLNVVAPSLSPLGFAEPKTRQHS